MKAKKSFGQHFLNSDRIAEQIVNSLLLTDETSQVLEVGPGRGMLTRFLIEQPARLLVVEADQEMVLYLNKYFPQLKNQIVNADFLKVPLDKVMDGQPFSLIGNFPYNISSQIVFKMLEYRELIPEMVGMFQKEVAERIIAPPGDKVYGIISVLTQAHYTGKYLFTVDKSKFNPPPRVQSAVIRLQRREKSLIEPLYELLFSKIVKQAFGQRRKMMRNTMKSFLKDDPILQEESFKRRPEQLSVEDFVELTHIIYEKINT